MAALANVFAHNGAIFGFATLKKQHDKAKAIVETLPDDHEA